MIEALYVPKSYGTYSDICLMLGLACLAEYALVATEQKQGMQLIDEGTCYRIQLNKSMDLSKIGAIPYVDLFPPLIKNSTEINKFSNEITPFNIKQEKDIRQAHICSKLSFKESDEIINFSDPRTQNSAVISELQYITNHNKLWNRGKELENHFSDIVRAIFDVFSQPQKVINGHEKIIEYINIFLLEEQSNFQFSTNLSSKDKDTGVGIFDPSNISGTNEVLPNSVKIETKKKYWLFLWLTAKGLFDFSISAKFKVSKEKYDWRIIILCPNNIKLSNYRSILNDLRKQNPASNQIGVYESAISKFDSELTLKFLIEFLNYHSLESNTNNTFASSLTGTHFYKVRRYKVKNIINIGLPRWITPIKIKDFISYYKILIEHQQVIASIDKEQIDIFNTYRDFITGNKLEQFFTFQILYGDYIVKRLANAEVRDPKLFSIGGLNLMVRSFQKKDEIELTKITDNPGFKNIAQAINSATVYAGKNDKGWERIYGLAQRLGSQTASKKDFIVELMAFIASYENENLRIDEELQRKNRTRRIWTTKEDLDSVIQLVEEYGSNLVGNLLIAYGYAKGWGSEVKKQKEAKATVSK